MFRARDRAFTWRLSLAERCAAEEPPLADGPHGGQHACFVDVSTAERKEVVDG